MIKKYIYIVIGILVLGLFLFHSAHAEGKNYDFDFSLPVPDTSVDQSYLGVSDLETFSPADIKASIVLIEIFSMYCPICQREAKNVNQLFGLIKADENLNRNIRMIGIGAGNSGFEAQFFKKNYDIGFPLFSDAEFKIHKMVKEVGTPHFFALKVLPGSQVELVFSHSGEILEPEKFLQELVRASGLEK